MTELPAPAGRRPRWQWRRPDYRPNLALLVSATALTLLLLFDGGTGPNVHMGPIYLVPVLLAVWLGGRFPGNLMAVAATLGWLLVGATQPHSAHPGLIQLWNLGVRLTLYPAFVEVIVQFQNIERRLDKLVRQRTAELQAEVTERLRVEANLRNLAVKLSAAEDVERRRIAYDIHDALGQLLGVIKLNLETVVAETAIDNRQYGRLTDVVSVVDSLIRQTRELTFDLHPAMLDHFGLVPTLQRFAEDLLRQTMAELSVSESGDRKTLPSSLTSYLFRSTKEVINNSVKHGNARQIVVVVYWTDQVCRIVVDDDGSGFDTAAARMPRLDRGLGLAGIDERLTSLGGRLVLESQPGSGARVILEVPTTEGPA